MPHGLLRAYSAEVSNPFFLAVGERVKEVRLESGLSREEAAGRMQLNPFFLARVERGRQNLSLLTIGRIALGLSCPVTRLFDGIEPDGSLLDPRPRKNHRDELHRTEVQDEP